MDGTVDATAVVAAAAAALFCPVAGLPSAGCEEAEASGSGGAPRGIAGLSATRLLLLTQGVDEARAEAEDPAADCDPAPFKRHTWFTMNVKLMITYQSIVNKF